MNFIYFLFLFGCIQSAHGYIEIVFPDSKYALDLNLFEDVLDSELCEEQMKYIVQNDTEILITCKYFVLEVTVKSK